MSIERPPKIFGKLGFSELLYTSMILILLITTIFLITGMGLPPSVDLEIYCENNEIKIKVINGDIPASDWQYIIFDEKQNPPITWNKAPGDLKTGSTLVIARGLPPGTYRVLIMHKPTQKIIFEGKVSID